MRRGVTFAELLMTVAIIGSATAIGIPKKADLERRATAVQILDDVDVIKSATIKFFSDSGYFPREEIGAVMPESLVPYLPRGFSFRKKGWDIDYDHWTTKLKSVHVKSRAQIGLSITIPDVKVGAKAMALYGANPKFSVGSKYTFVIVGL